MKAAANLLVVCALMLGAIAPVQAYKPLGPSVIIPIESEEGKAAIEAALPEFEANGLVRTPEFVPHVSRDDYVIFVVFRKSTDCQPSGAVLHGGPVLYVQLSRDSLYVYESFVDQKFPCRTS